MTRNWTFGRRIGAGFALIVAFALVIAAVSVYTLDRVVAAKDQVIGGDATQLVLVERMNTAIERKRVGLRAYLLVPNEENNRQMEAARKEFLDLAAELDAAQGADHLRIAAVRAAEQAHQGAADQVLDIRRQGASNEDIGRVYDERMGAVRGQLDQALADLSSQEHADLEKGASDATATANQAVWIVALLGVAAVIGASGTAWFLTGTLGQQVGTAVAQVEAASTELQTAANQQAVGAREQSTAMTEINTTIGELLATSRQIAESAQRVSAIAGETSSQARSGERTVERTQEAFGSINRSTDLVVRHMLELGGKSQQIGTVLDIVGELSEQTNILAINATIEAAGAGEAGRRFGVVAEEIRKLADRVALSTKEIRGLIDDVRSAVNTSVMATETGKKAVDAGARSFAEVATSFQQIAAMVGNTKDAAREIELSTKQQSTAVEQVNVAIANVAQSTRETEVSATQTQQTASQLAGLSADLRALIQARA
jgi:methyl-accepting chemotaxis protein